MSLLSSGIVLGLLMKVQVFFVVTWLQGRLKTATVSSHMAWDKEREKNWIEFFPIKNRVIAVIRRLTETEHLSIKK